MTLELDRPAAAAPGFERMPPQNIEAEQSVLGGMLLSKDAIADVVEILRAGDFYRPAHQIVYDAAIDLYGRGEPVDQITVAAELTRQNQLARIGGGTYLIDLVSAVPTAASAGYYARIVSEQAVLRRLIEAGTRIVQFGYGAQGGDVDDIVDRAQQAVFDVTERRTSEDYVRLEELLQPTLDEIEAIGSRDGDLHGVPTGFADLDGLTNGLHPGQLIILAARPAIGKALALDTPLPTPAGWTTMGDVRVGDLLLDARGCPTRVVAATGVLVDRPCFEVEFSDGTVVVADAQHQWLTETRSSRRSARTVAAVRTTAEIAATLRCSTADARLNHSVANADPLRLPDQDLPLPPYVLGAWLGDGHSAAARITTTDLDIVVNIEAEGMVAVPGAGPSSTYRIRLAPPEPPPARNCAVCGRGFRSKLAHVRTCGRSCGGRARFVSEPVPVPTCPDCGRPTCGLIRCQDCHRRRGSVQGILRTLGVLGNKHVPATYLRASEAQRRALLAGLMDTDGTVTSTGQLQFCVTSRRLAEDARELISSLGYRCSMTTKRVRGLPCASSLAYMINFTTSDDIFRLERKRLVQKERRPRGNDRACRQRFITAVRPVPSVPVRCVQVDNDEHRYLASRSMIPTHNSTLGLDLARSASIRNGRTSVIFSLEMSKHEITMRLLSAEARVSLQNMRTGRMSDDDWSRLARRMGEVANAPLFIDDSPNLTMMEIRAKARRLKQRHQLSLVIVDYMQLMSSPKRVESRQQEVSEISRSMKLLAKELEVPVVAISQLNRSPEQRADKKPQLSDLRESGSLEQDADLVILLYREDAFERESPRAGEADLIVAKHRNGPTATVTVAFQGHYSRFIDMQPAG